MQEILNKEQENKAFKPVPDVECLKYHGTPEKPDIKIFVSHRIDMDSQTIDNPLLIPVRCGAVYDNRENVAMLGDDTGENISEKRNSYCELTVQYWAWKNIKADYYGLCHYRRYLNYSRHHYQQDPYYNVLEDVIDNDTIRMYGLEEDVMQNVIPKYDLILPEAVDLTKLPEKYKSVQDHWERSPQLHKKDLQIMMNVLHKMHPEFYDTACKYIKGEKAYFCLICVMKRELFEEYCEWLFPLLSEIEKEIDTSDYTVEEYRVVGHLAERLAGIFFVYLQETRPNLRVKELEIVLFTKPQIQRESLQMAFPKQKEKSVPIVFATNNAFVPPCTVAIHSLLVNRSSDRFYDIVILESEVSQENKRIIRSMIMGMENVSIRFLNVSFIIKNYNLVANDHITVETYYRFIIQSALPEYDKVLYLDGDIVCLRDVAELYDTDINGYMIAAVHDADVSGQMNLPGSDMRRYLTRSVGLREPNDYFQAGVLLLNLKEMRAKYTLKQWLTFASKWYKYSDQDVLNRYCQGNVKFLPMNWNVIIDCCNYRVPVIINAAIASVNSEYFAAREDPYIIHYAGCEKPWKQRNVDFDYMFWKYARTSPFYEKMVFDAFSKSSTPAPPIGVRGALKNWIKKKAKKIFPANTRRGRFIRRIVKR